MKYLVRYLNGDYIREATVDADTVHLPQAENASYASVGAVSFFDGKPGEPLELVGYFTGVISIQRLEDIEAALVETVTVTATAEYPVAYDSDGNSVVDLR